MSKKSVLILSFAIAGGVGAVVGAFGGGIGLAILLAFLLVPLVLRDYRVGVVLLTLLLPLSTVLPQGVNSATLLTALTLGSFTVRNALLRKPMVPLPRLFVLCYILPATIAILVAYPHIPEAARNYFMLPYAASLYDPPSYVSAKYIKPLVIYFGFAFLLGNAVAESKWPQRFLVLMAVSTIPPCLAVFYGVAAYPGTFNELSNDREFMSNVMEHSMHANEFGMLFALASGPLLFLIGKLNSRLSNAFVAISFGMVTAALLLTFSRGGLLAYLIVVVGYLLLNRRFKVTAAVIALASLAALLSPAAISDRFSIGLRQGAIGDVTNVEKDKLTAGRVHGWLLLAPEVLESPLIGRGLGSTQWSSAVAMRRYKANHPHNIYLEVLMDMGVFGFCALSYLFFSILRRLKRLSVDMTVSEDFRAFYLGARFAIFGVLAMAATTAYYMPNSAQTFFWFACGVLFVRWRPDKLALQGAICADRASTRQPQPRRTRLTGQRQAREWS